MFTLNWQHKHTNPVISTQHWLPNLVVSITGNIMPMLMESHRSVIYASRELKSNPVLTREWRRRQQFRWATIGNTTVWIEWQSSCATRRQWPTQFWPWCARHWRRKYVYHPADSYRLYLEKHFRHTLKKSSRKMMHKEHSMLKSTITKPPIVEGTTSSLASLSKTMTSYVAMLQLKLCRANQVHRFSLVPKAEEVGTQ